ncbi:MAG TPA: hypothetical protein DEG47_01900, partial [Cyanobacteria bacterium UBA11148]|nr:hypothetical protein [Cyanobacteria bacterium UBA11148]
MVKSLSLFSAFLALAITSPAIAATFESTPFETLSVDSTTPLSKVFSTALQNGARYKIEASGQYTPDFRFEQRGEFWSVDARFVSRDNFATQNDQDPNFSNFDFGLFSTALGGDNDDFWGTYQSSHIYSYEFIG